MIQDFDGLNDPTLFTFWTGSNPLTRNRKRSLKVLLKQRHIRVEYLTSETITPWILPDFPIHDAFPYLTNNHRSDYLRSYFMFHYGGAYSDLKPLRVQLKPYFEMLFKLDKDFIGYPEIHPNHIAGDATMQSDYEQYCGNGLFIFKRKTDFAHEWMLAVNDLLDKKFDLLQQAWQFNSQGDMKYEYAFPETPENYSLRWAEVQGEIFHQLQRKMRHRYSGDLPTIDVLFRGSSYR